MELLMIGIFLLSTVTGYVIIKKVPSLLHTPLMSGMNALSGVTVVGGLAALGSAQTKATALVASAAVILAFINVVGGFYVTHRMLRIFDKKEGKKDE